MGGKVADTGSQRLTLVHHPGETPAGTDAFLLAHVLQQNAILAIQFTPGALYHHIKAGSNPTSTLSCKIVGIFDAYGFKSLGILSAYTPHLADGIKFQGLVAT